MHKYPSIVKVMRYDEIEHFINDVLNFNVKLSLNLDGYIFRGHTDENYDLIPSALRAGNRTRLNETSGFPEINELDQYLAEFGILRQFYQKSDRQALKIDCIECFQTHTIKKDFHNYLSNMQNWLPKEMYSLAGLAQHYGNLTSLLDWTYDIKVAILFAIMETIKEQNLQGYIDIWCLNKNRLEGDQIHGEKCKINQLKFIKPNYNGNPNLHAQKGLFTIWELLKNEDHEFVSANESLDVILNDKINNRECNELFDYDRKMTPYFYLFKIPKKHIKLLYDYLSKNECTPSFIFPGFFGIAKEIEIESHLKKSTYA